MSKYEYDVVIIGAGMGGLITGAILAKENRMKVLVLEKASEIGGRVISFGGPHGNYSAEEYRRLMRGAAGVWIVRTEPKLEKIVDSGLFRDHIIDVGWHGMSSADRCRFALTAKALGKELDVSPMVGFLYWRDGKWFQLNEYTKAWPKDSIKERSRIARERLTLSSEEASFYDHVDVKSYLESVTEDQNVRDYYATLAAIQFATNDITRISAGEWIKTNNMTSATGRHLVYGGGMGEVTGGFKMVTKVFAEIIRESGGEVRTNARVKEVEIKGYRAKGVVVEQSGKTTRIESSVVVSNLPMDKVFEVIPEHYFPKELRERIENIFPTAGISGNIKLKKLLETEFPKAIYALDRLPGIELRGPANFTLEQVSVIDPSRIINGKGNLMQVYVPLSARDPDEVHNKEQTCPN